MVSFATSLKITDTVPIGNKISKTGATAWAKSGRYTGITDVELTPEGAAQVASTAATLVGSGKVLDPSRITRVFVSPRKRARRTFELLLPLPSSGAVDWEEKVTYTEGIAEWNYGDYEGLKVEEIRELRRTRGLDKKRKWDIWKDGCEGGEYVVLHLLIPPTRTPPLTILETLVASLFRLSAYRSMQEVTQRLTTLISQIREIQRPCMNGKQPADVLLVSRLHPCHPTKPLL
jgi:probable phosphoglycerate mutase